MLILASKIKSTPILSLQTGSQLAVSGEAVVDPANLKILAYNLEANTYSSEKMLLRIDEIRELSRIGFIVDSGEDFILPSDVFKIKDILELDFHLLGMKVVDKKGSNLGKITDYTVDLSTFVVHHLIIKRPFLKGLNTPELTVYRSNIVAIDDEKITVDSETDNAKVSNFKETEKKFIPNYTNPFRN